MTTRIASDVELDYGLTDIDERFCEADDCRVIGTTGEMHRCGDTWFCLDHCLDHSDDCGEDEE